MESLGADVSNGQISDSLKPQNQTPIKTDKGPISKTEGRCLIFFVFQPLLTET